jgi:assimilatory nitrate reductase catalytic subunit
VALKRYEKLVRDFTPKAVATICGIAENDLFTAVQRFAQSPASLSLYCQGLNQSSSGTAKMLLELTSTWLLVK